jgi:hypothetical protein
MREKKDVKFIIYQMLYVFVICIIALKGADLNLEEVIAKDNVVEKEYADSLKSYLDSILALGLVPEITFDTTKKIEDFDLRKQLADLRVRIKIMKPSNYVEPIVDNTREEFKKEEIKEELSTEIEPLILQSLRQYTNNTITNRGNQTLEIIGSDGSRLATIPSGSSKTFLVKGQSSITYKKGNQSKTVKTIKNSKPAITLQRLAPSGEDVSIRRIQSTTGYRITITDDVLNQLNVSFSGNVSVKDKSTSSKLVYDVTLQFLSSKQQYERYTESRDEPYTVGFNVVVSDKIAGHNITRKGIFIFGEW